MKAESQCYREDGVVNTLVNGTNPGFQNGVVYEKNTFTMQAIGEYANCGVSSSLKERDYKDATDLVVYGIDRASFNQGENAKYDFSVQEEIAQPLLAKGPGGGTDTVGALCARNYKGVGNQYVEEGKVIVQSNRELSE